MQGALNRERPDTAVRPRILVAARDAFAARGFEATSLAQIARTVGVSQPLVSYYFGTKTELWQAVVDIELRALEAVVEEAIDDGLDLDARAAVELLIRRLAVVAARRPAVRALLMHECFEPELRGRWLAVRHVEPLMARIESVLSRAIDDGAVPPMSLATAAMLLVGATTHGLDWLGLVRRDGRALGEEEIPAYAETCVRFCLRGLGADGYVTATNTRRAGVEIDHGGHDANR